MLKFFNIVISTIFIATMLGVAGLLVGSMLPIPGNIEIKIVKSGSMEPAIPTGSLVIVKPSASFAYNVGDVITFGADTKKEVPTTHRIVAVQGTPSERIFVTKGDANEDIDQESVALSEVIGKVLWSVPGAGYVLAFAREPLGFALLIGIPAGLIIVEELITIGKEARAALRRRRGKDDEPKGGAGPLDEDGAPLRLFYGRNRIMDEIFVPMYQKPGFMHAEWWHKQFRFHKDTYGTSTALVLGLVFMSSMMAGGAGGTISYFNDIERSVGNIFRAGEWLPPEPPPAIEPFAAFAAVLGTTTEETLPSGDNIASTTAPTGNEAPADDLNTPVPEGGGGGGGSGGGSDSGGAPAETGAPEEATSGEGGTEETGGATGDAGQTVSEETGTNQNQQVPPPEETPEPPIEEPAPAPEPEPPPAEEPAPEVI